MSRCKRIGLFREIGDHGKKRLAEIPELGFADTKDSGEFHIIDRLFSRHVDQGTVGKDYISRHAPLLGQIPAQFPERQEQVFVGLGKVDLALI